MPLRIAEIRRKQRITQEALAKSIGVDQSVVSRYETGESKVRVEDLEKIAKALGVSVRDIWVTDEEEPARV